MIKNAHFKHLQQNSKYVGTFFPNLYLLHWLFIKLFVQKCFIISLVSDIFFANFAFSARKSITNKVHFEGDQQFCLKICVIGKTNSFIFDQRFEVEAIEDEGGGRHSHKIRVIIPRFVFTIATIILTKSWKLGFNRSKIK